MTPGDHALGDPIGTIVAMVTRLDSTLGQDTVAPIVDKVSGGRTKRRRLATTLTADPSLLTSGRSPAPRAVGDLLIALRAAGATRISPPRCATCDRELTSMQRRGEHWYCAPCVARPQTCASCGQQRHVAFRDRHGHPRCSQCPDHDTRDPQRLLVQVIGSLNPGLSQEAVSTAVAATINKPAHAHKLAWAIEEAPELLTGDGAKAPFPMALRLIDALCEAGASGIVRPRCPRCARTVALSKRRDGLRICRNCCARANAVPCSGCGTVREPATRDADGRPLCPNCLVRDPLNLEECIGCRRRQRVNTRTNEGPICATCVPHKISTCTMCGRTVPCMVSKTTGQPRCRACARAWAECARCGQWDTIRAGTRDAPLCAGCAVPDPDFWKTCPTCGNSGRLIAGTCRRCQLRQRLAELLTDTAGAIRPELQVLHDTLAVADRPATVLSWLQRRTVSSVLADLATGQTPLSHADLDTLPPSKPVEHLRSVLVATAALPARDEHLARIERWVAHVVAKRHDPNDKEILHRYAVWHLLRRLGHRNRDTRPPTASSTRSVNESAPQSACSTGCTTTSSPWPPAAKPIWRPD